MTLRFRSRLLHLLLIGTPTAGSTLAVDSAAAQESSTTDVSPQVQYRQATEAFQRGDFAEARRLLLELWYKSQTYDVAVTLGQAEYQLQQYGAAARYLAFAIEHFPPAEKPETLEGLKADFLELKKLIGVARIEVDQPSAEVVVDGEVVGRSPLSKEIFLGIGPHTIEARLGKQVASQTIDVFGGNEYPIELVLGQPPPAPAAVGPDPGLQDPEPAPNYTPAIIAISAGSAALITGGILFGVAAAKDSKREELGDALSGQNPCGNRPDTPDDCQEIANLADEAKTFRAISFAAFGTALAAGVVTYFVWPHSTKEETGFALTPTLSAGPSGAHLGAVGRF